MPQPCLLGLRKLQWTTITACATGTTTAMGPPLHMPLLHPLRPDLPPPTTARPLLRQPIVPPVHHLMMPFTRPPPSSLPHVAMLLPPTSTLIRAVWGLQTWMVRPQGASPLPLRQHYTPVISCQPTLSPIAPLSSFQSAPLSPPPRLLPPTPQAMPQPLRQQQYHRIHPPWTSRTSSPPPPRKQKSPAKHSPSSRFFLPHLTYHSALFPPHPSLVPTLPQPLPQPSRIPMPSPVVIQ